MFRMSPLRAAAGRAKCVVCIAALAVATTGLLAGCGDDSTASSTPASPANTSAAAPPPTANGSATESSPVTQPGEAATEPPETPQAMPSDFPGPDAPQIGPREQAYIDALKAQGIQSSGNGESAITIANYVCAAQQQGTSADVMAVNVNAMAGVEQNLTGGTQEPAQAGPIYIDVAKKTYCK